MSYRATLSCDQPDCTTSLNASVAIIDQALRTGGWKTEETEQGTFYTCPHHEPDTVPVALRMLATAGRQLLMELRDLDDAGYYVTGFPADGGGAALHVHPYEGEDDSGPFVSITQSGRSFRAQLLAGDGGPVVFDEGDRVWE
jgi:hypothetical protein